MKVNKSIKSILIDYWKCGAGIMWLSFVLLFFYNLLFRTWLIRTDRKQIFPSYWSILNAVIGMIISAILFFHPRNYRLFGYFLIFISVPILIDSALSPLGVVLYTIGASILMYKDQRQMYKSIRYTFLIVIFCTISFSGLRFDLKLFVYNAIICCIIMLTVSFVIAIIQIEKDAFVSQLRRNTVSKQSLSVYLESVSSELSRRDIEWLVRIAEGEKYESIAVSYNLSHNYVRNRMSKIYKLIHVSDYHDFIATYINNFQHD